MAESAESALVEARVLLDREHEALDRGREALAGDRKALDRDREELGGLGASASRRTKAEPFPVARVGFRPTNALQAKPRKRHPKRAESNMTDADPWLGEPFDDDVPWADPNIRKDYEAALGRFILLFNELDYHVGSFIRAELERSGQSQLFEKGAGFSQRLPLFGVLACADTHLSQVSVADLRSLNGARNLLAHGHFDQNPFDGSYKLVFRRKYDDNPIAKVEHLADQMTEALELFRSAEAVRGFEPVIDQSARTVDDRAVVGARPQHPNDTPD